LANSEGELVGRPVSRGVVEGRARVAFSVSEAAALQPGEILVAPITDVGWTPYFSLISGLITDVGSAVSHGAVIAREYGLPAIVNTRMGTKHIRTGDRVRLDAETGVVTVLS
jgi:phosphohistidine swiveling domain-containing protein